MPFSLNPETQHLLEQRVESGRFATADDVIHAALRALDDIDALTPDKDDLEAIDRAEDEIERGEVHEWSEVRDKVRASFLA
jgi:putative addiction module CopG family antidote